MGSGADKTYAKMSDLASAGSVINPTFTGGAGAGGGGIGGGMVRRACRGLDPFVSRFGS